MAKHMTPRHREQKLRKMLMQQKKQLLAEIKKSMGKNIDEDVRLAFEAAQDNPDKSVAELVKYVNAAVIGNKSEDLDRIDAALIKMQEGTYGICEECGSAIPLKRLQAVIFATHCVTCQQEVEVLKEVEGQKQKTEPPQSSYDYCTEED